MRGWGAIFASNTGNRFVRGYREELVRFVDTLQHLYTQHTPDEDVRGVRILTLITVTGIPGSPSDSFPLALREDRGPCS